jgi:hypothetical protein
MSVTTARQYLSCAETTQLVRRALLEVFPGTKFSVRSRVYSGGASIDVSWKDGPRRERVERLAKNYEGADFDGMQDLKTYHDTVLAGPNGARLVHFGADFVFCSRTLTLEQELTEQAQRIILDRCAVEGEGPNARFGNEWVDNLARAMACALDFEKGTALEDTFREVVLREPAHAQARP